MHKFHQNTQLVVKSRPFTTQFPGMLSNHEQWIRSFVADNEIPNGEDVTKMIVEMMRKLFLKSNRGGNILLRREKDRVSYEINYYNEDMGAVGLGDYNEALTVRCVELEGLVPSNEEGVRMLVENRQPTTSGVHPGVKFSGTMMYQ